MTVTNQALRCNCFYLGKRSRLGSVVSMMNNTTSNDTFSGYAATATFEDGVTTPVYVINARAEMAFKDGSLGPAVKVQYGQRYLVAAGHRYAVRYSGSGCWIKAARISRK